MIKTPEQVGKLDGRYSPAAYRFVYDGLAYTLKRLHQTGHVSGQALCHGLVAMAIERWGMLAPLVLQTWGIQSTNDFGHIVYALIRHELMTAQPGDSIHDFDNVFDLGTTLKAAFRF